MDTKTFEGISETGDVNEALENAAQTAKEQLPTDLIRWTLLGISGQYGGFVGQKQICVKIAVQIR